MKKKIWIGVILAAIAITILGALFSQRSTPTQKISGEYKNTDVPRLALILEENKDFIVREEYVSTPRLSGTYKIEGNKIIFNIEKRDGGTGVGEITAEGIIEGDEIIITKIYYKLYGTWRKLR